MTRGFTRILVPTDFSAPSESALATAKDLAVRFGASLHLVHVLEDPYAVAAYSSEALGYLPPGIKASWQQEAEKHLNALLTPAERAQFMATTTVLFSGSAAREIVDHARNNHIDLIVMGTHGRGGVAHLLLGSVTERVVRTATCPVLTVRGMATARESAPIPAEGVAVAG
ncbi:MAG TPA: universal stress protein [Vicinamibacterales bacterium]|nr:universal stress protein [Vicinamibacterales bacterium]